MADDIEVPVTIVQTTITVPVLQEAPKLLREENDAGDAKISALTELLLVHMQDTDVIPVARPGLWTRKTPIATLAAFLAQVAVGAAILQEDAEALPKKISELTATQVGLSDADAFAIVQQGVTVRANMLNIANYLRTVAGSGNLLSPIGLNYGANVTAQQQIENTQIIQALHDDLSPDFGGKGGVLYIPGVVKFGGVQRHPAVSMMGDGRGTTQWICADDCPYIYGTRRVNGVVTPNAPGTERAMIYGLARAPFTPGQIDPTEATQAWFSVIKDVTINGNKANQSGNWVAGIYDESGKSDPNYMDVSGQDQEAKAYSGMYCENVEAYAFSGDGFATGGDRQRAYWHVCRSLNNGIVDGLGNVVTVAGGWNIKGNDSIIGPRCGGGGCTDVAVNFAGPSGASITQGNFWGGHDNAANAATAVKARGCNGICFTGNTWNANVVADYGDGSPFNRAVVMVGNRTQYDKTLFPVANGVPIGLEHPYNNAAYTVVGYKQFSIHNNTVTGTSNQNYSMLHLLWATDGATGGASFDYSTAAGVKPFASDTPIMVDGGASCTYAVTDVSRNRTYGNAGVVNAGTSAFIGAMGALATAEEDYLIAGSELHLVGSPKVLIAAAAPIPQLNLYMPPPRYHGHTVQVYFVQNVTAFTLNVEGQDSPVDGGALQNIVKSDVGVPGAITAGTTLEFRYNRAATSTHAACEWYLRGK